MRFPEFEGEWKKKKFDQICTIATGNKNTQDKEGDGDYPFFVRSETIERINSYSFDGEAILTAGDGVGVGKIFHYVNGKVGVHQRVYILSDFKCFGKYAYYYFTSRFYNRVKRMSAKNSVDSVRRDMIAQMSISLPGFDEQSKIARFLSLLDERIATQNKIIEQYKSLINGLIDLTFANADRTPYSIANLGEPFRVMGLSKDDLSEDGRECILYGELFTTYGPVINEIKSKTRRIIPKLTLSTSQDLLFPSSTTVDARSLISPSAITKAGVILGGDMFGIRVDVLFNNRYLSYLFNSVYKNLLAKYAKGSTIVHLHYSEIKDVKIELPDLLVQNKIVKILSLLENKLGIETALQSMYQSQKEYLLRGVFI